MQGKKFFMYLGIDLRKNFRLILKKTFILITAMLASVLIANKSFAQEEELVRVFRWYNPNDQNYVTASNREYQEGQMLNWNWKDKTLLFVGYSNPAPGRVDS